MARPLSHPLAEYPLDKLPGRPLCSLPVWDRTYLTIVMLESSLRQCAEFARGRLLDVGCGKRPYEKTFFAGASEYIGADYLSDRSTPDVFCSATSIPFPDNSFDTVTSTEVLEHVPAPSLAMQEMSRVLKPGGYLILSMPLFWPRHDLPYDFYRYPYDGVLHLVKEQKLELVKLFNRGRSYAMIGQAIQQVQPFRSRLVCRLINSTFLGLDRRLKNDVLTLGWTVVVRKPTSNG